METHQHKRRTYYIKNSIQGKFILQFVTLSLFGGIAALAAFNFLAYKKIDAVLYSMRLPNVSAGGLLWREMLYTNIFVAVFILLAFIFTAKRLFIRIHGPLKKMTNDLGRIANGDLNLAISLRNNDEFRDVAEDINDMTQELNRRLSRIRQLAEEVIAAAEDAQTSPAKLRESIAALKTATGSFVL